MKTITALTLSLTTLLVSQFATAGDSERARHFKGITPTSVENAQEIIAEYNGKIAELTSKGKMEITDLGSIHMYTYTLENAVAYLREDLTKLADTLETLHLLSESTDIAKAQAQGKTYLKDAKIYQK